MKKWIGMKHKAGTHWEMLVAESGGQYSIILDDTHYRYFIDAVAPHARHDFTGQDPWCIDEAMKDGTTLPDDVSRSDAQRWLDQGPRIWRMLRTNEAVAHNIPTSYWKTATVGELSLNEMMTWIEMFHPSPEFFAVHPELLLSSMEHVTSAPAKGKKKQKM